MAGEWFLGSNPMNQLGNTIGRSPNGQMLPSVAASVQADSNAATAAALEAYYAEERRRWDQTYQQNQTKLDRDYELAKRSARTADESLALDRWYKKESAALARERLALDREQFQASTGLEMLKTAASLRGPENYYVAADFARGTAGNPQTATFLSALQNNTRMADYGAQGGVPQPETMDSLTAKLTGANSASNAAYDNNNLAVIGNIAAKGPHQLAAGALEQLTDTERKLFTAGLDKLGYDTPTFLQGYARSRVGQNISANRVA